MHTRRPLARFSAALLLVLHVLVAGLVPFADAAAEAAADPVAHVEESGSQQCAPVHDHASCEFCRVARTAATPARPSWVALGSGRAPVLAPAVLETRLGSGRFAPVGPRAPPLA